MELEAFLGFIAILILGFFVYAAAVVHRLPDFLVCFGFVLLVTLIRWGISRLRH